MDDSLNKFYNGKWVLYCPECSNYIKQSDPQGFTGGKSVIIDDEPCEKCTKKREEEIKEAQEVMGRLGLPKESK
jgi:hypothetical protein